MLNRNQHIDQEERVLFFDYMTIRENACKFL